MIVPTPGATSLHWFIKQLAAGWGRGGVMGVLRGSATNGVWPRTATSPHPLCPLLNERTSVAQHLHVVRATHAWDGLQGVAELVKAQVADI